MKSQIISISSPCRLGSRFPKFKYKIMSKKIYLLLLLFTGIVNAQIVNIPDTNFKARLIELGVDLNIDGNIQVSEAQAVTTLDLFNRGIVDITGIEEFSNLATLDCGFNLFSSLDVSMLSQLFRLECGMGQITTINAGGLTNLRYLYCSGNPLGSLNVTGCSALYELLADQTQLTSFNATGLNGLYNLELQGSPTLAAVVVDGLPALQHLMLQNTPSLHNVSISNCPVLGGVQTSVGGNIQNFEMLNCPLVTFLDLSAQQLSSINLTGCTGLQYLSVTDNQLSTIDLATNVNLTSFYCPNNLFFNLDLSANINLSSLDCRHNYNMTALFIKNGKIEINPLFDDNPALAFLCADEEQLGNIQSILNANNMTSVAASSYCTFFPGGNYNTITGAVYFDADNNGCSTADVVAPNIKMTITDGSNTGATFINNNADYRFYTNAGNFTVTPSHEISDYFTFNPASAAINFPMVDHLVATQNFCMTANGVHPDLEVILAPSLPAVPGFNAIYYIVYKNKGNQTVSGSINLTFDDARTDFTDAVPMVDNQSPNTLSWNFTNLLPFQTRLTSFMLHINSPVETPPVNAGDILNFTVAISDIPGDETPADNSFELDQLVVNAYDPNDKTCLEGTSVLPENIGKYLHYNINFENTGTADAINIVVKDIIDTTRFDLNSLQLLYASHPVYTKITGNIVEFIFENINLPPSIMNPIGGHGNVLFKIKTLPTLTVGDEVSNTANIYFDYNAPIDTNEARTAFNNLSKTDFVKDDSVTVYPNPAKNKVTVKATGMIKSVQLYDVQGRILQSVSDSKSQITIDIANQQRGVYFLKIITDKGSDTQKIIKE